ncbi:hypothetical protein K3495_g9639 [Podosphaera aphanis]|nr:hypothetical protein K3495_g9639 [Podosphaera aphanis]
MRSEFFAAALTLIASVSGLASNSGLSAEAIAFANTLERRGGGVYHCEGASFTTQYIEQVVTRACSVLGGSPGAPDTYYPVITRDVGFLDGQNYYRYPLKQNGELHQGLMNEIAGDYFAIVKNNLLSDECLFITVVRRKNLELSFYKPPKVKYQICPYTALS